jgi:subfamily B ATP-binding cassette protein MsbA
MIAGKYHSSILNFFREIPVAEAVRVVQMKRLHVAVCVGLSAIAAVLDGLMLLMLIPISQGAAAHNFDFVWNWPGLRMLSNHVPLALHSYRGTFLFLALLAFLLGLGKSIAYYGMNLSVGRLYGKYSAKLSNFIFRRYLSFGQDYFDAHGTGKMAALIDYNHDLLNLFQALLRLASEALVVMVCVIVMAAVSWRLTLIVFLVFPLLYMIRRWIAKRTAGRVRESQANTLRLAAKSYEVLRSIPLYRSFVKEDEAARAHAAIAEQIRKADFHVFAYEGILPRAQEVTTLVAMLFILVLGFAADPGRATPIVSLFVFFFIARLVLPRLGVFHEVELQFEHMMPKMREFFDIFNDKGKFILHNGTQVFRGLADSIRFNGLTFAYPNRPAVLHNLNLIIPKGRMTALVGPSGAGKTTLASLLLRYRDVPPRTVLLDGVDIRSFTSESLRKNMALVSQDVILLNDTLRNNLIFGVEEKIDESHLRQAVADACLEDLVETLPDGLETKLGPEGVALSGGQRQRIAIARALLKQAPVLILDEATSALDSETERLVQKATENATRGCTSLIIAHRFSTIQRADKVVVLESGEVSEEGTFRELLDRRGRFYEMWKAQVFDCAGAEEGPVHMDISENIGTLEIL